MESTKKKLEEININYLDSKKVVRQIKFHEDFDQRPWEKQKEYLIGLASSLNHAAETAYNERDAILEQMNQVLELNKNAALKADQSQTLMVQSITESNTEKQELMKRIQELKAEIREKDQIIKDLSGVEA